MDTITTVHAAAAAVDLGFDPTAQGLALGAALALPIAAGVGVAIIKLAPKLGWSIFSGLAKRG